MGAVSKRHLSGQDAPDVQFDQLFVNGVRQIMARYPNYDPAKKDVPYRGSAADAISPERVAKWPIRPEVTSMRCTEPLGRVRL